MPTLASLSADVKIVGADKAKADLRDIGNQVDKTAPRLGGLGDVADKLGTVLSGHVHSAFTNLGDRFPVVAAAGDKFHRTMSTIGDRLAPVRDRISEVTQRLTPLKNAAEKVGDGFLHAGGTILKFGGIAAGIGLAAVAGGVALVASKIGDFVHAGEQANETAAQTAAVLKSTGGAAGVTAAHVDKLSTALMNQTGIDDDTISSTQNMLLTFTNIGAKGGVFDQATKTALDMSTALGQDTKSSAIQLGKALNDPLTGITALQRVGVTFNQTQKDQIKAMMDAGNVAGAQGVILKELNKEFGGSAEAAGKANGGVKILQAQLGNMEQSIGQAVIPIIGKLVSAVSPLVQQFATNLPGALDKATKFFNANILPVLSQLAHFVVTQVVPAVERFAGFIMTNVIPAVQSLAQWVGKNVMPVVQTLATIFITDVLPALGQVWGAIQKNLVPALEHAWEVIAPKLIPILEKLGAFLKNVVAPIIANVVIPVLGLWWTILADLAGAIFGFIDGALSAFGAAWQGLVGIVSGVWTAIEGIAVGSINFLIDRINDVIDLANHVPGVHFDHINHIVLGGGVTTDKGSGGSAAVAAGGGKRFASGGYSPGGPILVGESGPEIVMPPAGSRIASNSETVSLIRDAMKSAGSSGGQGHTFNIHVHQSQATAKDIAGEIEWQMRLRG